MMDFEAPQEKVNPIDSTTAKENRFRFLPNERKAMLEKGMTEEQIKKIEDEKTQNLKRNFEQAA